MTGVQTCALPIFLVQEAADAIEEIVRKGALLAMNKVNMRKRPEED